MDEEFIDTTIKIIYEQVNLVIKFIKFYECEFINPRGESKQRPRN